MCLAAASKLCVSAPKLGAHTQGGEEGSPEQLVVHTERGEDGVMGNQPQNAISRRCWITTHKQGVVKTSKTME